MYIYIYIYACLCFNFGARPKQNAWSVGGDLEPSLKV